MRHILILVSVLVFTWFLAGCGEQPIEEITSTDEITVDTIALVVTDTIGVFTGDSTREFGTLHRVRIDDQGNIFALDGMKARITIFSPGSEVIRTIGRSGSGPGEFQFPTGFAFLRNGGLVVNDFGGHTLSFFDESFTFDSCITGFYPIAPVELVTGPGNTFVGGNLDLQGGGEGYSGTSFLGRYTGDGMDPEFIYRSYPLVIEVRGEGEDMNVNVQNVDCVWESDAEGNIYFAVRSDSSYHVELFQPDGAVSTIVEKEWERITKTEEELAIGDINEGLSRTDEGATTVRREEIEEINPYHLAIGTLSVDDDGNVWVSQDYALTPTFEVYDNQGTLLRVVTIPDLEGVRGLRYCFTGGMLAYDYAPLDYPKIYMLEYRD